MPLLLSVILPTHNPRADFLARTLAALATQTLPASEWEIIVVDNASAPEVEHFLPPAPRPGNLTVIRESQLGLTAARRAGFRVARGEFAVLVDDDNLLDPLYLENVLALFASHPRLGAIGGPVRPQFEAESPAWTREFHALLALRDLGSAPLLSQGLRPAGATRNEYPAFAPVGAGMALRRAAWVAWLEARSTGNSAPTDRRGRALTSGGDNDIVLCAMQAGWEVGYFPNLALTHLIPRDRLQSDYLARLNHGIQKSWMQVLSLHRANPWPALTPAGSMLRKLRAWFTHRAWASPAARIRWAGACGHFEGRVAR